MTELGEDSKNSAKDNIQTCWRQQEERHETGRRMAPSQREDTRKGKMKKMAKCEKERRTKQTMEGE